MVGRGSPNGLTISTELPMLVNPTAALDRWACRAVGLRTSPAFTRYTTARQAYWSSKMSGLGKINISAKIILTSGGSPYQRMGGSSSLPSSTFTPSEFPFASADLRHSVEVRSAGMQFAGTYRSAMSEKSSKCRLQIGKL
jgi:hypothetical protein